MTEKKKFKRKKPKISKMQIDKTVEQKMILRAMGKEWLLELWFYRDNFGFDLNVKPPISKPKNGKGGIERERCEIEGDSILILVFLRCRRFYRPTSPFLLDLSSV